MLPTFISCLYIYKPHYEYLIMLLLMGEGIDVKIEETKK